MAGSGIGRALVAEFEERFEKGGTAYYNFPGWQRGGRRVEVSYSDIHDMTQAGKTMLLGADAALTRTLFAWLPILAVVGLFLPTILYWLFGSGWWIANELRSAGIIVGVALLVWRFARIHMLWLGFNGHVGKAWGDRTNVPSPNRSRAQKLAPYRTMVLTLLMLSVTVWAGGLIVLIYTGGRIGFEAWRLLNVFGLPTIMLLAVIYVLLRLAGHSGGSKASAA